MLIQNSKDYMMERPISKENMKPMVNKKEKLIWMEKQNERDYMTEI